MTKRERNRDIRSTRFKYYKGSRNAIINDITGVCVGMIQDSDSNVIQAAFHCFAPF